jgi:hypothetical protein
MDVALDTFLVTVYTVIDALYRAHLAPLKPPPDGHPTTLSDSEVLTLLIVGQWRGNSERALYRHAAGHWRAYFPRLGDRSSFNRRARARGGVLVHLLPLVAAELGAPTAVYEVLDGVPVPLMRRCRGERHRLFGEEAGIGRGGSDRDWYYGCELLVAATDRGAVTGFLLGPPATDDRWLADAPFCWRRDRDATPWQPEDLPPSHHRGGARVGPTGPIWPRDAAGVAASAPYVADGGFHGAIWAAHWRDDYGATVLTPRALSPDTAAPVRRQFAGWRQVIETVNARLAETFHLAFPRARSRWGVLTRLAAKLVALNLSPLLNQRLGRPPFAAASLFA